MFNEIAEHGVVDHREGEHASQRWVCELFHQGFSTAGVSFDVIDGESLGGGTHG